MLPPNHLIDFEKYAEFIRSRAFLFLNRPGVENSTEKPDQAWISETLLKILDEFPTGITQVSITDQVVSEWKAIQHEYTLPRFGETFSCIVKSISFHESCPIPSIGVFPELSKQSFDIAIHPSIVPLIRSLICSGRRLACVATNFIDSYMAWPRALVIELDYRTSDFKWLSSAVSPISSFKPSSPPKAILARIVSKTKRGFHIIDDSISVPLAFVVGTDSGFLSLLEVGDLIVIWKPEALIEEEMGISIGSKTAIARLPKETMRPGAINFDVHGTVLEVKHSNEDKKWFGSSIIIQSPDGGRKVLRFPSDCEMKQRRMAGSARVGHYIYVFRAIFINEGSLRASEATSLYDLSLMAGFYTSNVVRPTSIYLLSRFTTAVIFGSITEMIISECQVHADCGRLLNANGSCLSCETDGNGRKRKDAMLRLRVEDGIGGSIVAYAIASEIPILNIDIDSWNSKCQHDRIASIRYCVGSEYVFGICWCNGKDFEQDGEVCQILWAMPGEYEVVPSICHYTGALQQGTYTEGSLGEGLFQSKPRTHT